MKRSPFQLNFKHTALLAVLAIAACGGDGGGGFTPPEIPSTPITIDNTNESAVIGTATTSTSSAMGASLTVDPTAPAATQALKAANLAQSSMAGMSIDPQVVNSATEACSQGGSVTITLDSSVQPSNTYTPAPGDTLSMTANNCQSLSSDINGTYLTTVNGSVSVTFNQVSTTDVSVSFNGFSVTEQGSTATIHGDIRITDDTVTSTISGNSLYLLSDQGDIRLTNYSISSEIFTDNVGTGTIVNASYGVDSSVLGGHLDIDVTNVTKYDADQYASSGTIVITGGNMIITITIVDNANVTVTRTDLQGNPISSNPDTWGNL